MCLKYVKKGAYNIKDMYYVEEYVTYLNFEQQLRLLVVNNYQTLIMYKDVLAANPNSDVLSSSLARKIRNEVLLKGSTIYMHQHV